MVILGAAALICDVSIAYCHWDLSPALFSPGNLRNSAIMARRCIGFEEAIHNLLQFFARNRI
jgi:hypothetical protein